MKRITLALPAPYVGLRPFDEKDALIFFGRDGHVRDLLAKLGKKQRFIAVLGASGTGKSSLVRAGLIPALHRGALASAGYHWNVHIFKPGDAPLHNLVHALTEDPRWIDNADRATAESSLRSLLAISPLALTEQFRQRAERFGNEALLLVVDQFEEIFRYDQKNSDEAEAFIQLLLRTASEDVPIYVVMTMRSDFLGNCVAFFGLPEAINSGLYLTPRLGPDPLKSIIASPLALAGGDIDPVLVTRLINTLGGDDELPILEHALLRMWNHAKGAGRNRIDMLDFEAVCAPHHAEQAGNAAKVVFTIDNHASSIFAALTEKQQLLARQMFLALVESRDGRDVRRPQTFQQLTDLFGTHAQQDLQIIIDAFRAEQVGFLLPPFHEPIHAETQIDISHESLFRQWHLFQQWLKEEALDISELKEWQQRAQRQQQGGGWLDENDCIRAQRWRERINTRADAKRWAGRYGEAGIYEQVSCYIDFSMQRLNEVKIERERLEQEKSEAVNRLLRVEARNQRETAERAEKEKLQAQAFAKASRRRSVVAMIAAVVAIVFAIVSVGFYYYANQEKIRAEGLQQAANIEKDRAEKLARDAKAGELIATAENLINHNPEQSVLLGLVAQRISAIPRANAFLRFALANFYEQYVLYGHEQMVTNVQFSSDGQMIVTASRDNTARVWDAVLGKVIHILKGHEDAVLNAQFSPDDQTIVTASGDNTARVWDVTSGKIIHVLNGHDDVVNNAQFSPDGRTVVTVSKDNTARMWDVTSGKIIHVLNGHDDVVNNAQFSPDGQMIVTASGDNTARVWNAVSGKEIHVLDEHRDGIINAQYSPDGQMIVTVSWDSTARLWDAISGKEIHILNEHDDVVNNAQFSPDGQTVVTISEDSTARLWNAASGKEIHVLRGHEKAVLNAEFSPDGQTVVTVSKDKTARLWGTSSGKEIRVLKGHDDEVGTVQFSPDGQTIVTGSADKTSRVWDVFFDKEIHIFNQHQKVVFNAQFSPNGQTVVTASLDKTARVWDTSSGEEIHVLSGHSKGVINAQFSPDGLMIMTASRDGTARMWDVTSGKTIHVLNGHEKEIINAQYSPNGQTVVTAGMDSTARVWDASSGKEIHVLNGHVREVINAQYSPDGQTIVTASWDKSARIWNVSSGKLIHVLNGHKEGVAAAQFSPDNKMIVTASADKTARVWDASSGKIIHVLNGHGDIVNNAQFSPDGQTIVTSSADNTIRIWDTSSGKEIRILFKHERALIGAKAQFSPDGQTIVTSSEDSAARLWDAPSGKEIQVLSGHEAGILNAQFSADGKKIVTASEDKTARIWRCEVCRPIQDIAAELQQRVGRELTPEERRRFSVPDNASFTN